MTTFNNSTKSTAAPPKHVMGENLFAAVLDSYEDLDEAILILKGCSFVLDRCIDDIAADERDGIFYSQAVLASGTKILDSIKERIQVANQRDIDQRIEVERAKLRGERDAA